MERVKRTNTSKPTDRHTVPQPSSKTKQKPQQQPQLFNAIENVKQQQNILVQNFHKNNIRETLLDEINQWEKRSIEHIRSAAKTTINDLKKIIDDANDELENSMTKLSKELNSNLKPGKCTESDIEHWTNLVEKNQRKLDQMCAIKIQKKRLSSLDLISIESGTINPLSEDAVPTKEAPRETEEHVRSRTDDHSATHSHQLATSSTAIVPSQQCQYESAFFAGTESNLSQIHSLFEHLKSLPPMDKNGPMSGSCDLETTQMETFLFQNFGFRNRSRKYIVQGVKAFRLGKPLKSLDKNMTIYFPTKSKKSFDMTVQEILNWQSSYAVYADKNEPGMSKEFLLRALRGQSDSGEEAFHMKFVVRVSQCPILMEFDARIISRKTQEEWPHRIKLVSVTGIDFAGRIHDLNDITTYVANWQDVYEIDQKSGRPVVYNGRDFRQKTNSPRGKLHKELLLNDLMRMARLRLLACDREGVQIVVETGIGLGVFAGKHIGIDGTVRALSARAIRTVLEEDGPNYKKMLAVVFALPVFDADVKNGLRQDVYQAFVDEFNTSKYKGRIPVLIADQDMHRLTVAIARLGFVVSELNPADSHGVFGEYWQNRGPAVEEKLALTTVGLLVQHHLINPQVLDPNHYQLI